MPGKLFCHSQWAAVGDRGRLIPDSYPVTRPAEGPMSVQLTCPECRAKLTVSESLLGKTLRCKSCGETFKARARAESADDEADRPRRRRQSEDEDKPRPSRRAEAASEPPRRASRRAEDDEDDEEEVDERPARKAGKKRKAKRSSALYIVGVAVAFLVAAGAIAAVVMSRPGGVDPEEHEREAARPAAPRPVDRYDLSEHIRLTFNQFGILQDDRPAAILRAEFLKPQKGYFNYVIVSEEDDGGRMVRNVDESSIKDGKFEVIAGPRNPATRTLRLRVWIARKKPSGKADDLVVVSNVVSVPP